VLPAATRKDKLITELSDLVYWCCMLAGFDVVNEYFNWRVEFGIIIQTMMMLMIIIMMMMMMMIIIIIIINKLIFEL
jgi:hypothetical protein